MRVDTERIRKFLDRSDFTGLFNYLGWDNPVHDTLPGIKQDNATQQVASKRGVGVWQVDGIPGSQERRLIDREVSKQTRERLLIFVDGDHQLWIWPETRPSGVGHHPVTHKYQVGTMNEHLVQRLAGIRFHVAEEDDLTVMDVLNRVRGQFKANEVTKEFYDDFREHHEVLTKFIIGIENLADRSWYGSVLLNRLMFIYFLQKKGFLEGDRNYLRNRLSMVRRLLGEDSFYGFFRKFLLPLFHEGFGSHQHLYDDPNIAEIIGKIPYVNGAIFDPHYLEEQYDINIPDREFERIFDFFEQYRWHLDERPTYEPNEINPDILGYVFEKLVNQKEQGAYYTKEDITGYMTSATVIPALLDRLDIADDPMELLLEEPERYIYDSISYGIHEALPDDIAAGAADPTLIVDKDWFEKSPHHIGLPGETWWETIDRHRHYRELRKRVEKGEIRTVDDAITANLDLRTLITDFLGMLKPIESVESAYRTLQGLTILDPTCGSGAFLFAALDILADCYKTLLDRAEELSMETTTPNILLEADEHPNRMYFIYKQAMLNNLYGVDLMREAGEIARLRMFLKLAAQLNEGDNIEPLPGLDFNIKTGNLLVGIAHLKDAEERLGVDLLGLDKLEDIKQNAIPLANLMNEFSQAEQQNDNPNILREMKGKIKTEQENLRSLLNNNLYEIRTEQDDFNQWVDSHQPFHWFVEFPSAFISNDGFDIVIGNPPYISRTKVTGYKWRGFATNDLANIFNVCVERSLQFINPKSRFSMILPVSFQFRKGFDTTRNIVTQSLPKRWISTYDKDPEPLFAGVKVRVVILSGSARSSTEQSYLSVTRFYRCLKKYRPVLFENIRYTSLPKEIEDHAGWLKIGSPQEGQVLRQLLLSKTTISNLTAKTGYRLSFKTVLYQYISSFIDLPDAYDLFGNSRKQSKIRSIFFPAPYTRNAAFVISLSKISLLWWACTGDGFDLTQSGFLSIPISGRREFLNELSHLAPDIHKALKETLKYAKNAKQWVGNYDAREIRHLTDQIDKMILHEIGMDHLWPDIQLFNATFMKQCGGKTALIKNPRFIKEYDKGNDDEPGDNAQAAR